MIKSSSISYQNSKNIIYDYFAKNSTNWNVLTENTIKIQLKCNNLICHSLFLAVNIAWQLIC